MLQAEGNTPKPRLSTMSIRPTDSCVEHWLQQAAAIPLLSAAEEVHLGRLIQRGQAPDASVADQRVAHRARRRMISANLRLVVSIARTCRHRLWNTCLQFEDLLQEGCLGLNRAAEKFNPEAGYKFSTYAFLWVRQAIGRALEANAGCARLPHQLSRQLAQPDADTDERERLRHARQLLCPLSLDAPLHSHNGWRLVDGLADGHTNDHLEQLDLDAAMHRLQGSGIDLQPLTRVVVNGESLSALAREHGISKQAVSKRIRRDRQRLAVVASPDRNLVCAAS